jgi:murein DD-endopeptidase MepM/ murein hydrolase activator NlpD
LYQFRDINAGAGGGAAALNLDSVFHRPVVSRAFGNKVSDLRSFNDLELVVDLGVRIGSREWFRGLLTCAALCYAAYSFAPAELSIAGASPPPFADGQVEEVRALSIAPLALGGDTGRRMAPTDVVVPLLDAPERPSVDLSATFGTGDGFARMLERSGVGSGEADYVAGMIGQVVPITDIAPGTSVQLTLGRRPNPQLARPLDALRLRARFDLGLSIERLDGRLVLTRIPIAVDDTPLRIQGRVGDSLYRSARAAGAPARTVEAYIRALATQLAIGQHISPDDRFDIIVAHRRAATGDTEIGNLLFAGLQRPGGRNLQLMPWTIDGRTQWFEASGVGRESGTLAQPVPGRITSTFGARVHPILRYTRMHSGVDFGAAWGTPIVAVADGQVTGAGWAGGYGRQVRLEHSGGLATSYSHMSSIAVAPGTRVRRGQVIGYVGSSGLSTGAHLHYELHRNGQPIDPLSVRFISRAQLEGAELEAFRSRVRALLSTPAGAVRPAQSPQPGFSIASR